MIVCHAFAGPSRLSTWQSLETRHNSFQSTWQFHEMKGMMVAADSVVLRVIVAVPVCEIDFPLCLLTVSWVGSKVQRSSSFLNIMDARVPHSLVMKNTLLLHSTIARIAVWQWISSNGLHSSDFCFQENSRMDERSAPWITAQLFFLGMPALRMPAAREC